MHGCRAGQGIHKRPWSIRRRGIRRASALPQAPWPTEPLGSGRRKAPQHSHRLRTPRTLASPQAIASAPSLRQLPQRYAPDNPIGVGGPTGRSCEALATSWAPATRRAIAMPGGPGLVWQSTRLVPTPTAGNLKEGVGARASWWWRGVVRTGRPWRKLGESCAPAAPDAMTRRQDDRGKDPPEARRERERERAELRISCDAMVGDRVGCLPRPCEQQPCLRALLQ